MTDNTRTLCIVDMQDEFYAYKNALKKVIQEIKLAKKRKAAIIVLEYEDSGETVDEIKKAIGDYNRVAYGEKDQDGGAEVFFDLAEQYGYNYNKVRICGVNRKYCVYSTALGMIKDNGIHPALDVDLEIAIDATWCEQPGTGRNALLWLTKEYSGRFIKTIGG